MVPSVRGLQRQNTQAILYASHQLQPTATTTMPAQGSHIYISFSGRENTVTRAVIRLRVSRSFGVRIETLPNLFRRSQCRDFEPFATPFRMGRQRVYHDCCMQRLCVEMSFIVVGGVGSV